MTSFDRHVWTLEPRLTERPSRVRVPGGSAPTNHRDAVPSYKSELRLSHLIIQLIPTQQVQLHNPHTPNPSSLPKPPILSHSPRWLPQKSKSRASKARSTACGLSCRLCSPSRGMRRCLLGTTSSQGSPSSASRCAYLFVRASDTLMTSFSPAPSTCSGFQETSISVSWCVPCVYL